ncbi:hypothetical protein EPA93_08920 [Ktedonosporobacter rubrisoli]|uniref:Uncharacterized protein n=1 Tax=Ktedonosporobacter rubrisoli TaxID=2509675 RepID=A0A4P6JM08_KTERU|nr:hypothetical protein [Ktedonosporobacter rubrisoli]QBD76123.1 hypothetical protein EPA93_08920 [Ktedonosporobacter rubrisoli]
MPPKSIALILIILVFCVACGSADNQQPTSISQSVTVELDIYSGQPNPTWMLTTQERSELVKRLQKLPTLSAVPSVDNLGYRGFLIHNPSNESGIGTEVRVYQGSIIITDQGNSRAYKDSHALEQWLKEQASVHGQADVLKAVTP